MIKKLRAAAVVAMAAGLLVQSKPAQAWTDYVVGYRYSQSYIQSQGIYAPIGCSSCGGSYPDCLVTGNSWTYQSGVATNAAAGDAVAYTGPGITAATGIGFIFTHIGLMNGQVSVRHNTADPTKLATSISLYYGTSFWGTIKTGLALLTGGGYGQLRADAWAAYNMVPGLSWTEADGGEAFGFWRGYAPGGGTTVNYQLTSTTPSSPWRGKQFLLPPTTSGLRTDSKSALTWMSNNSRYYRLFAFENMTSADSGGGNVCSATVATATKKVTLTASTSVGPFNLTANDTGLAVLNLEAFLYNTIRWDFVSPNAPAIIGSGDRDGMASGVTDQIVSCFTTLQSTSGCSIMNHDYHYRAQASTGVANGWSPLPVSSSVAPDHIMLGGVAATTGKTSGGVTYKNKFGGYNAGPWNAAPIVTPTWMSSYWTHNYYGQCVATQNDAG